jgi:hypothetical protein
VVGGRTNIPRLLRLISGGGTKQIETAGPTCRPAADYWHHLRPRKEWYPTQLWQQVAQATKEVQGATEQLHMAQLWKVGGRAAHFGAPVYFSQALIPNEQSWQTSGHCGELTRCVALVGGPTRLCPSVDRTSTGGWGAPVDM